MMASKRSLYRPAQVQENVGQRKNRKTLAQGRLITNGGTTQGSIPVVPVVHHEAPLSTSHVSSASQSRIKQGTRSGLQQGTSNVSTGNRSVLEQSSLVHSRLEQSSMLHGTGEESFFAPRREVPSFTEQTSPKAGHPAGSLDLSDTDSSHHDLTGTVRSLHPQPVLCIDASRQTKDPDMSEVDIRIGVERSPAKIVCHSPAALRHLDQQSQKVPETQGAAQTRLQKMASAVRKEKIETLAGSHIDPYTAVQSIPMSPPLGGERRALQPLTSNLPQPNFDDSGESERSHRETEQDDTASVKSDDTCSLNEYVTSKPRTTAKQRALSSKDNSRQRPETAKKKKPRVVASRYMQPSDSKAKASLSARMDKSALDRTKKTVASRSMEASPSARKTARKPVMADVSVASQKERPHTPENCTLSSTGGKTSTPTMDGSMFHQDMDIDASAIHPEVSLIAGGDTSKLQYSSVSTGGRTQARFPPSLRGTDSHGQSMRSQSGGTSTCKPKTKLDLKAVQNQLDLLAAYDLQWTFLECKARKTFQDQEKQAMAQLLGLHDQAETLRKQKAEKEQQYARLRHSNMTDDLTDIQRQCLGPVTTNLPRLQQQYQNLAQALDTTRHQIQTKDIYLPENEDEFQASLQAQLLESEKLLGEISVHTRQHVPSIVSMATGMTAMEQAVEGTEEELKRNRELLAAAESLTMHECSLRVQEIQLQDTS